MSEKEEKKKRDDPYALKNIYVEMELELIASFRRNLVKHKMDENDASFSWEMWQLATLRNIETYRKENMAIIGKYEQGIQNIINETLQHTYTKGQQKNEKQHGQIELDAGSYSFPEEGKNVGIRGETPPQEKNFFRPNEKKLKVMIESTKNDFENVNHAIYRKMDDVYRQTIFKTSIQLANGSISLDKAIDKATEVFLAKGIDSIVYANGRHVNIATYAEMALRTTSHRATLLGEGSKRDEYGNHLVVVSAHANSCNLCMPWQGQVLIDDVFSHPSEEYMAKYKGKYKLLSQAIKAGLMHPNCRHTITTYFEGITRLPMIINPEEAKKNYDAEQKQRHLENLIRKAKRKALGSVDVAHENDALIEVKKYQRALREYLEQNSQLKRRAHREKVFDKSTIANRLNDKEKEAIMKYISPDAYKLNDKLRNGIELSRSEQRWVENLDSALAKMPAYTGKVTRSLSFMFKEDLDAFLANHMKGKPNKYPYYLSSTCGEVYNEVANVQLTIESKKGKDVRYYNQREQEILFFRDSEFIVSKTNEIDGVWYIDMEEL